MVIETERLILRRWREADLGPYAAMMADEEVSYWLGGGQTRVEAKAHLALLDAEFDQAGYGIWVIERRSDGAFVGSAGLAPVGADIPFAPAVEAGWRLARSAWGHGYATEAARAAIADGFSRAGLAEIVTFTAHSNLRSQSVMERLGFERDPTRDFDHPKLAADHPLHPHIVYVARAGTWPPIPASAAVRTAGSPTSRP